MAKLGINLPAVNDWGAPILQGLLARARPLGSALGPADQTIGASTPHAFPSGDFGARVAENSPTDVGGPYTVEAGGKLTKIEGAGYFPMTYDAAKNITRAEMFIPGQTYTQDLIFRVDGKLRYCDIHRVEQSPTACGFSPELLKTTLSVVDTVRGMDLLAINGAKLKEWADRAVPGEPCYGEAAGPAGEINNGYRGYHYEGLYGLLNALGSSGHINVPWGGSDSFQKNLAALALSLRGDVNDTYELGNENWNQMPKFTQSLECAAQGAAWAASRPDVQAWLKSIYGGVNDPNGWRWTYHAERVVQMSKVLRSAGLTKARVMLGGQAGWTAGLDIGLQYIKKFYGTPSQFIDVISIAPYFGGSPLTSRAGFQTNDLFGPYSYQQDDGTGKLITLSGSNYIEDRLAEILALVKTFVAMARSWSLIPEFYEFGYNVLGEDDRLEDVIFRYIKGCFDAGVDRACYYTVCGPRNFPFSLQPDISAKPGPRMRGYNRASAYVRTLGGPAPAPVPPSPIPVPNNVGQIDHIDMLTTYKDGSTKSQRVFP